MQYDPDFQLGVGIEGLDNHVGGDGLVVIRWQIVRGPALPGDHHLKVSKGGIMFTGEFIQTSNSCAAATLMIALHEFDPSNSVNLATEKALYAQTRDQELSNLLGIVNEQDFFSSPANIKNTANGKGLTATLCMKSEIDFLPADLAGLKTAYIDTLKPVSVDTAAMKTLLDSGPLQLLVYVDMNISNMHWLLLREDNGAYYLYDTAFGTNEKMNPDVILDFNAEFTTGRQNNFLGVAFHLTMP